MEARLRRSRLLVLFTTPNGHIALGLTLSSGVCPSDLSRHYAEKNYMPTSCVELIVVMTVAFLATSPATQFHGMSL